MHRSVLFAPLVLLAACSRDDAAPVAAPVAKPAPAPLPDLALDGFAIAESAIHDAVADVYLVSNIDGKPCDKDGKAAISRVTPDGKVEREWIAGGKNGVVLNAPKGLAIQGDTLWVADIDVVRKFDRASGAPRGEVAIAGATFLNDVSAAPDGSVWVTDSGLNPDFSGSGTDAVYAIDAEGKLRTVAKTTDLHQPNGIVVLAVGAYVVTWATGEFLQVDGKGRISPLAKAPQAQLDGLVRLGDGRWLCSSWAGKCLYEFDLKGGVHTLDFPGVALEQPADIGFDAARGRVLVPLFTAGKLLVRKLGS